MTRDEWKFLQQQIAALVAGREIPSIREPDFGKLLEVIGIAAGEQDPGVLASLGNVALAALLDRLILSARAERAAAMLLASKRRPC